MQFFCVCSNCFLLCTYLYVIKVAVIWMLQLVRFKLKVDGEPFLGGDGPDAVDGRVVGDTVLAPLVRDVSMPYEPLVARLIWERATSDVWNLTQGVWDQRVYRLEAHVLNGAVG